MQIIIYVSVQIQRVVDFEYGAAFQLIWVDSSPKSNMFYLPTTKRFREYM